MAENRRGFLAQCLGGIACSVLPATVAAKASGSATSPEPATSDEPGDIFSKPISISRLDKTCQIRVETDGTPNGTVFLDETDRRLLFVDEMLVEFNPSGLPWVGLGLMIVNSEQLDRKLASHEMGLRMGYVKPDRNGDVLPEVRLEDGSRLPMLLVSFHHDATSIPRAFVSGAVPVKFTRLVEDMGIEFLRCKNCGRYERRLHIPKDDPQFVALAWKPTEDYDTLSHLCPVCHSNDRELVPARSQHLRKLYMTSSTSHLVFGFNDQPVEASTSYPFLPAGLNLSNRPMWLIQHMDQDPVAQLSPQPSYLNDTLLSAFRQMLRG